MEITKIEKTKKLALKTQVKFLQRFTELVENGFAITAALEVMAAFMTPKTMMHMQASCAKGEPFSDALEKLKFESRIVYIVRAGEKNHALVKGLQGARNYSSNYLANRTELAKKLRYPLFLFSMVMVVIAAVFILFIPRLSDFYTTFGIEGDQTMITGVIAIIGTVLFIFLAISLFVLLVLKWDNEKFQLKCRKLLFSVYGVRQLAARIFSYYFATQMEMFISCGLSFKDSMATIRQFETVPLVQVVVKEIEQRIEGGESIEQLIRGCNCFTPYFRLITTHALRIGKLDVELKRFVDAELASLNAVMTSFIKLFQGTFLALTGGLIVMLYLSILQPVFELITII
ncbi:MAG: type II secretion system F family protein [Turicibacter sp.]|nr:type II secretion system F family protein [Turicibacter sp.]